MRLLFLLLIALVFSGCFLFKDYKRKEFLYSRNGQPQTLRLLVPKGYVKEVTSDTAGLRLHSFQYPDGATLYAAYLTDTTYELQSFNRNVHVPLQLLQGGQVYKGQDADELFYREIRQGNLRFGYKGVPRVNETYFDSATNYASWQRR